MAKYTIVLYYGTGFNAVNVPDSLVTLQSAAQSTLTITDNNILSVRGLTEFTVAATYAQVKDADYCYVYNQTDSTDYAFFSIAADPTPNSDSVQTLSVILDPLLSCGGTSAITFLGGITDRYCVPLAEDTFGAFTEPDPYMAPSQALRIDRGAIVGNGTSNMKTYYQSFLSLDIIHLMAQAAKQVTNYQLPGLNLYYGGGTGTIDNAIRSEIPHNAINMQAGWKGHVVVVPAGEAYFMDEIVLSAPVDTINIPGVGSTSLTGLGTTRIYEALQFAFSLGIENPVLNAWQVPGVYLDTTEMSGGYGEFAGSVSYTDGNGVTYNTTGTRGGRIEKLVGINTKTDNSTLPFEYKNVKNKRVLVGEHNRYCLASTCSGSSAEYNPEDIYDFVTPTTAPYIWLLADPRPNGMPYARYKVLHGDSSDALFFMNAVPGMVWQRAPLVFYDKAGNLLDEYKFKSEQTFKDKDATIDALQARTNVAQGGISGAIGRVSSSFGSAVAGINRGIAGDWGEASMAFTAATEAMDPGEKIRRQRGQQKYLEQAQFMVSQSVVSPTLQFPRNESIRDMIGNGFISYRYRYTDADADRIDQILTMYGYKVTAPVNASNAPAILGGRPHFNYVKINGASVTSAAPKWLNDELSAALSTGVRIWHEKPDNSYYTSGNI